MRAESPSLSYFICATPRSGTNLLCGLLRETGVAGWPDEYFPLYNEDRWPDLWQTSGTDEYLRAAVAAGTTENGVCGIKVFWRQIALSLFVKLREVDGRHLSELELLKGRFPNPRFIWLSRRDEVAQAVSFAIGRQTKQWNHSQPRLCEPQFSFEQIQETLTWVTMANRRWAEWFGANGIAPFTITYEELVDDMEGVTRAILAFLGIEPPSGTTFQPWHKKQADAINADWIDRYTSTASLDPR